MSSYTGKHAEYYDIFYQNKPYGEEAAFIHRCLQRYTQGKCERLLELACGSGRHAFELEKLDYRIVATDYSPDLLRIAEGKAKQLGSHVEFKLQDMRALRIDEARFDAAYCLFDSIGYLQTNEAISRALGRIHDHLRGQGLFVFEFWHAAAMLRHYEPERRRSWKTKDGEIARISRTRLDVLQQLAEVHYIIEESNNNGQTVHLEETQVNRYFLVQEMAAFLQGAGFEPLDWLHAYSWEKPIDEDTWHILAIARRGA